ncbi:MAG: hypothetical protein ACLQME_21400 [Alphaproteobacteria bacterium]
MGKPWEYIRCFVNLISAFYIDCPYCGNFALDYISFNHLQSLIHGVPDVNPVSKREAQRRKAVLAYSIRKMNHGQNIPALDDDLIRRILSEDRLPNLSEQADNLLR